MKKLIAAAFFLAPLFAGAQAKPADLVKVTVAARGHDVREVLTDVFQQAKKSCVIQQSIHSNLFLSLEGTPFDQALDIICKQSDLSFQVKDGVYYISQAPTEDPVPVAVKPRPMPLKPKPVPAPAPIGKLPATVLNRIVTTRLRKAPIRIVLDAFGKETGIRIELDPQVPAYKLDAFLLKTSLKYALDEVTQAANLTYKFTDRQSILVAPVESKVSLIQ